MVDARRQELIEGLRARIAADERARHPAESRQVLPFGIPELDGAIPGGGLQHGALHEVIGGAGDAAHAAVPARFVGGILARTHGGVIWTFGYRDLFAPALAAV
ncbi:MAG: damage-inducible protein, partial [Aliidongia sp.]